MPARNRLLRKALAACCWLYLAVLIVAWLLLRFAGDRWWLATLLLFGPRLVCLLPLPPLAVAAVAVRRRCLIVLAAAAGVAVGPILGFQVPLHRSSPSAPASLRVRVLTCNIHQRELDAAALRVLINRESPDIVALQEWRSEHQSSLFGDGGWYVLRDGQLFLASRYPIRKDLDLVPQGRNQGAATAYRVDLQGHILALVNVHLYSPHQAYDRGRRQFDSMQAQIESNSALRRRTSRLLRNYVDEQICPVLLAGDFNTPSDSLIYRECWSDLCGAFDEAGLGVGITFWAHRSQIRIDHILGGPGWRCCRAWVTQNVGSCHRPLIADMLWSPPERYEEAQTRTVSAPEYIRRSPIPP